jgi:hypothetical protein
MSDDSDILDQADKLMRRHRVFLAGSQASAAVVEEIVDDLPVLTDMVAATEAAVAPPAVETPQVSVEQRAQEIAHVLAHELLLERLSAQRQAVADEIATWLDTELPHIVMHVVDGLTDHLVAQVTTAVRLELLPKLQLAVEAESQPSQDATKG